MNMSEYQEKAVATAIYKNEMMVLYPVLGLCGETGEVAEKIKKLYRDGVPDENGNLVMSDELKESLKKELGDVLWYLANLSNDIGLSLEEIAQTNIDKLKSRKERGVLQGSGDNR